MLIAYPRILPGTNHFTAQLHELSAANHSKGNECVHRVVDLLDGFVVGRELIDLNSIRVQLFVDLCLKFITQD